LYFGAIRKIPNIVTCHDLLAVRASRGEIPGWKVSRTGTIYQQMVLRHVARFQRIISVSETTKRDLIRLAGVAETRTEVIPTAMLDLSSVIDNSKTEQVVRALGINSPYIMHSGNNSPYKNRSGAVSIYREFAQRAGAGAPRLLMTGKPIPPELLRSLPSDAYVVEKPTDEQVTALYSHAEALVFPSLFEGFGLPILEAQMRDCPVFASDRGPMNEIGGDAALYFDPSDEALAGKFIFDNWTAREEMRTRGRRNVLRFERACVLGQLTTAYERVLS
jgi:glycosyltransferase involved in cell wall biosynthesis